MAVLSTGNSLPNQHTPTTIQYTVHRTHLEEMVEQRRAEVILHTSFLELIYDYTYKSNLGEEVEVKAALFVPKNQVSVSMCPYYHEDDKDKVYYYKVEVFINGSYQEFIYVKTIDEAQSIYKKIKNWMLQ